MEIPVCQASMIDPDTIKPIDVGLIYKVVRRKISGVIPKLGLTIGSVASGVGVCSIDKDAAHL